MQRAAVRGLGLLLRSGLMVVLDRVCKLRSVFLAAEWSMAR